MLRKKKILIYHHVLLLFYQLLVEYNEQHVPSVIRCETTPRNVISTIFNLFSYCRKNHQFLLYYLLLSLFYYYLCLLISIYLVDRINPVLFIFYL
jgi:hypothetical protein